MKPASDGLSHMHQPRFVLQNRHSRKKRVSIINGLSRQVCPKLTGLLSSNLQERNLLPAGHNSLLFPKLCKTRRVNATSSFHLFMFSLFHLFIISLLSFLPSSIFSCFHFFIFSSFHLFIATTTTIAAAAAAAAAAIIIIIIIIIIIPT